MANFAIKLCWFLILTWRVWRSLAEPASFFLHDNMGWHEKRKIMALSRDLFKESLLNMRQIIEIRNEHDTLIPFNVGMIMGRIKEKYRWMMETYRDILDMYDNRHYAKPPGMKELRSMYLVLALETMHYLEIEIDKLVDVLIDEGTDDLNSNRNIVGQTEPRAWWKEDGAAKANKTDGPPSLKPGQPTGPYVAEDRPDDTPTWPGQQRAQVDILREQMEKSRIREQFLMKKLGMSANMTTMKKRFLRHWPVEDTWSLDKYNQDYK